MYKGWLGSAKSLSHYKALRKHVHVYASQSALVDAYEICLIRVNFAFLCE